MEATEPRVPICYARKCYAISVSHMITYMFHVNTSRSFPHSWSITYFVARVKRRVPLVEQKQPTFSEHLSVSPVFSVVRIVRTLVFCVVLCRSLFVFLYVLFWSLYVFLWYTNSDYPFGIVKLFWIHA
jgi:hypothetical protein